MGKRTPVIESLNTDLALEHGAIIQYLFHAVQLRDTPLAGPVMEMAREEMWHMDWLVEAIGEREERPLWIERTSSPIRA